MNPKVFCNSIRLLFIVFGMFYIASSFVVSKTLTDWIRPAYPAILSRIELVRGEPEGEGVSAREDGTKPQSNAKQTKEEEAARQDERLDLVLKEIAKLKEAAGFRQDGRFVAVLKNNSGGTISPRTVIAGVVQAVLFLAFLSIPCGIAYFCLIKPLREYPYVSRTHLEAVRSKSHKVNEPAAKVIAKSMVLSAKRELQRLKPDDARTGQLKQDKVELDAALRDGLGVATAVQVVLKRREELAQAAARKYAQMAGLTVALSSSAMGDGIGMLFWKARLVHETFRIYGFRPGTWTVLRIYAYVLFAVFLAASVEDLCEMLDAPEVLGGFGVRVLQGVLGAAIILKGGQLTRAYLTEDISPETRKAALERFRETAMEDLKSIGESVKNSIGKIGAKKLIDIEDIE